MLLDQLIVGVTLGSVYSLIAIGFSLIFRTTGLLNFAHPEFMMAGGLIGYTLTTQLDLPLDLAIPLASVGSGLLAVAVGKIGIAPIRRRSASLPNQIIATLGWAAVLSNGAMILWGPFPLAYSRRFPGGVLRIGDVPVSPEKVAILFLAVAAMAGLHFFFRVTRVGCAMRASADDEEAAMAVGINPSVVIDWGFFLSGALAGLAGMFIGMLFFASFDMGTFGLRAFAAAVLGGFGDVVGAAFGGILLGIIDVLGSSYLPSGYRDTVAYGVLIVILLLRPYGLLGRAKRVA
jgi:branched-chain amino acid transport system permease protein